MEPIYTEAATAYPYSKAVAKQHTFKSRFDEEYRLYKRKGSHILLPRSRDKLGEDLRVSLPPVAFDTNVTARNEEQARVMGEGTKRLLNGESFIIQAPTGFGKTVVPMPMIAALKQPVLVIGTKDDIQTQWYDAFDKFLGIKAEDVGLIRADSYDVKGKKVSYAMIHSICKEGRYPDWVYRQFGLVIFDEVHRMSAEQFSEAIWLLPAKQRLGLSATPYRKDGKDNVFLSHIGQVKVLSEAMPMIPKILTRRVDGNLQRIPHKHGRTMHLNKIFAADNVRNGIIVSFIKASYAKERNTVFFADTKKELQAVYDMLTYHGISDSEIGWYIGGKTATQRDMAKAKPIIMATYKMTSEATDVPWWDTCVLGSPRADVTQIVGRILREFDGKPTPVVLDLIDYSSKVFRDYWGARQKWYNSIGAPIVSMN